MRQQEWGSRSERNEMEWNEANEEIRDRHHGNRRGRKRRCRGRYPGSSAAAADSGGWEGADR